MATITEKGKLIALCEKKSGTSQAGRQWVSCTAVFEIPNVYGSVRRLALKCVNDRVQDVEALKIGDNVEIVYIVSSNEWQGRWFTNAELCRVQANAPAQPQQMPLPASNDDDLFRSL